MDSFYPQLSSRPKTPQARKCARLSLVFGLVGRGPGRREIRQGGVYALHTGGEIAAGRKSERNEAAGGLSRLEGKRQQLQHRVLGALAQVASLDLKHAAQLQAGAHTL